MKICFSNALLRTPLVRYRGFCIAMGIRWKTMFCQYSPLAAISIHIKKNAGGVKRARSLGTGDPAHVFFSE